jgi:plasmid maintenance system killer protein
MFVFASLNYEKLACDREGYSSVRINDQFRLIFQENLSETEPIQVIMFSLEEISNHYS